MEKQNNYRVQSSFRDPSGFLFYKDGILLRQINRVYQNHYRKLIDSGLCEELMRNNLLIPHEEVGVERALTDDACAVIKPDVVPFISYPYEWCFSQLKDAALLTLRIQKEALRFGMSLKDSSAYNIQFFGFRPVLVDTLSFEEYKEGTAWIAYRQFCEHFLAPLALMSYKDIRLNQLLRIYIDGIPLDLATKLLPLRAFLRPSLFMHLYLHAWSQKYFSAKTERFRERRMNRRSLEALIDNLEAFIKSLRWQPAGTEWGDYYDATNYSDDSFKNKALRVEEFLKEANPKIVWDLGANTGVFSRIAAKAGAFTLSFDIDPVAVEKNYRFCKEKHNKNILPLVSDLTNPSPALGWENKERMSLSERDSADTVLALALIHHFAISNNLPFVKIAEFFSRVCDNLIIEFVPKGDSNVRRLLLTREDIFPRYTKEDFEADFQKFFTIFKTASIEGSQRILYLMKKNK